MEKNVKLYFTINDSISKILQKIDDAKKIIHKKIKVLIVEDNKFTRKLYKMILNQNSNIEIVEVENGLEGIEAIRHHYSAGNKFDVIILDIEMPEMNGIEFLRELNGYGILYGILVCSTNIEKYGHELEARKDKYNIAWMNKQDIHVGHNYILDTVLLLAEKVK